MQDIKWKFRVKNYMTANILAMYTFIIESENIKQVEIMDYLLYQVPKIEIKNTQCIETTYGSMYQTTVNDNIFRQQNQKYQNSNEIWNFCKRVNSNTAKRETLYMCLGEEIVNYK